MKNLQIVVFSMLIGSAMGFSIFNNLQCNFKECCDSPHWLMHNVSRFEEMFENHVFGQHIVKDIVSKQLRGHLKRTSPKKALVLSFHGKFHNFRK